jgi:ribosomal protein L7/L12
MGIFSDSSDLPRLQQAVMVLQAQVSELARRAGIPQEELDAVQPAVPPEVRDFVAQDQPLAAVRAYRKATGASLLLAKQVVDEVAEGRR